MPLTAATAAQKAHSLYEALPYIQLFFDKNIVIIYGGNSMTDTPMVEQWMREAAKELFPDNQHAFDAMPGRTRFAATGSVDCRSTDRAIVQP